MRRAVLAGRTEAWSGSGCRAPAPQGEVDPTCAADAPCAIERLDTPPLVARADRPKSPFY
jgi:hypothetical protein